MGQHCTSICMTTIKTVKIPNASMDVEEIDDSYIVDRNIKWEIHFGKCKWAIKPWKENGRNLHVFY